MKCSKLNDFVGTVLWVSCIGSAPVSWIPHFCLTCHGRYQQQLFATKVMFLSLTFKAVFSQILTIRVWHFFLSSPALVCMEQAIYRTCTVACVTPRSDAWRVGYRFVIFFLIVLFNLPHNICLNLPHFILLSLGWPPSWTAALSVSAVRS